MKKGKCVECPIGHACADGLLKKCKVNTYQPLKGQPTCKPCGKGESTQRREGEKKCYCNVGYFRVPEGGCQVCPAGSMCLNELRIPCPEQTSQMKTGQPSCDPCGDWGCTCGDTGLEQCHCKEGAHHNGTLCTKCLPGTFTTFLSFLRFFLLRILHNYLDRKLSKPQFLSVSIGFKCDGRSAPVCETGYYISDISTGLIIACHDESLTDTSRDFDDAQNRRLHQGLKVINGGPIAFG